MRDKLTQALEDKKDHNNFANAIWKYEKKIIGGEVYQDSKKLIDMDLDELQRCFSYTQTMLYNEDPQNLGRFHVLKMIQDQRSKCNTELFIRYIQSAGTYTDMTKGIPRFKFLEAINEFVTENKELIENILEQPIGLIMSCPEEFNSIPIGQVIDGLLDKLGRFNKKHITMSFLTKQGLWFTSEESAELTVKDTKGNIKDRLEVVKENLNLKPSIKLYLNPRGIKYKEFQAMIGLRNCKYSELSTLKLRTLRDSILFRLEDDVKFHIEFWQQKQNEIFKIAKFKNYNLLE